MHVGQHRGRVFGSTGEGIALMSSVSGLHYARSPCAGFFTLFISFWHPVSAHPPSFLVSFFNILIRSFLPPLHSIVECNDETYFCSVRHPQCLMWFRLVYAHHRQRHVAAPRPPTLCFLCCDEHRSSKFDIV